MSVIRSAGIVAFVAAVLATTWTAALAIPSAGAAAPNFSLPGAHGGTVTLSQFKGKPLYLNFFASWCAPCNEEAGDVSALYGRYHRQGLAIVGIDELENKDKALGFARQHGWPFAIALDADGGLTHSYGVVGLPVHIFIDKQGRVSLVRLGEMQSSEIEEAIKKIL